ncbi:hypothetical protein AKJ45_02080 [candidate division MSBL1 archaeon SCGC-AAA261F19]|uniref:Uncharacterized protein n=1 Tax=candidate division MSBL1 archaeon SCGC-AAA261F19 TaxID=1698275 RepID=A0A133V9Y4_9EURY|nr:hypothetical protein AKJ45_02080 [candidate division MSBL1 archaeon SCGC-AAA261F19]
MNRGLREIPKFPDPPISFRQPPTFSTWTLRPDLDLITLNSTLEPIGRSALFFFFVSRLKESLWKLQENQKLKLIKEEKDSRIANRKIYAES